ncbi:MAG: YqgE/AlgH family protein [Deltaproteobacteria bacterium]|nr:YqgE/AlgH family protein [Deltaproteobacteria bacterium]MBK8237600.1 YqgE/AlgH family protein [Deltaproteobacteria bacterium]MBP7287513.1 YqgE/AlgH family protein [Nannocystaceae bacterium]
MSAHPESLVRHVLCAVPQLVDPNFRRAVVLMLDHDDEGALGLVVNHLGRNHIADVVPGLGLRWCGPTRARVRIGGPVSPSRGWILHDDAHWDPAAQALMPELWLTTSLEHVVDAGHQDTGAGDSRVMFLLGYAGWAPQQLEAECAQGSWLPVPIGGDAPLSSRWLFETPPDQMWEAALRAIGIDPGRVSGLLGGRVGSA